MSRRKLLLTHERNKAVSGCMLNTVSTHGFQVGSNHKAKPLTLIEGQATILRTKPLCDPSQDDKAGRDKGSRCNNGRRRPAAALVVSVNVRN